MRRSHEDIEKCFNPINHDHIFQENYLSPWIEEREGSLLYGTQNLEWLPIDSDDEILGDDVSNSGQTPSQSGDGGSSPPNDGNSGGSYGNGDNGNLEQSHGMSEGSFNYFQE